MVKVICTDTDRSPDILKALKIGKHLKRIMRGIPMKQVWILLVSGLLLLSMTLISTTPPCSPEELLETSDYAVEGYVIQVECGRPYNSGECKQWRIVGDAMRGCNFKPELIADCVATVEVTACLKGDIRVGDEVNIPFLKVVQECENGERTTFGKPKKDIRLHSKIRYYNSSSCAYSNVEELEKPQTALGFALILCVASIGILTIAGVYLFKKKSS